MVKIKISPGNAKIGKTPNVSLIPGASCVPGVPCAGSRCYALKAFRQYPSTRAAWTHNHQIAASDPRSFTQQVSEYCQLKRPAFFRWHVAGDIPGPAYFAGMLLAAKQNPATTFLCFTKNYSVVNDCIAAGFVAIPQNLRLMLSAWPGLPLDNPHGLPVAWLTTDTRKPHSVVVCPGTCGPCRHCWADRRGIAFDPH